ncbi:MAG: hypothetical protein J6P16_00080 [Eubacterium sp.]|nr:hypothetical protein [Eubacterium sp.]
MGKANKRILSLILTFAVALATVCGGVRIRGVIPEEKISKAAEGQGKYVKTIEISNASDKAAAEAELGDEYTVLDTDFGKSSGVHSWIGYSTTDDPGQAITDIKVMDMTGDFNYSDYEKLLEEQKQAVNDQMDVIVPAVKEYAKNHDAGYNGAVTMYYMLNCFYEDDSQKGMGDYLLDAGRALMTAPDDTKVMDDLVKVFMQGNDDVLRSVESILIQTQGSKPNKSSWMIRMSNMGPDGLNKVYKEAYPTYSNSKIKSRIKADLEDTAALILENLSTVQDTLRECEQSELWQEMEKSDENTIGDAMDKVIEEKLDTTGAADITGSMTDEEAIRATADSINDAAEASDMAMDMTNAALIMYMKTMAYGKDADTCMYDFFMRDDLKTEDLYPMAYQISKGQKSLMEDVGLYGMFTSVLAEGETEDMEPDKKASLEAMAEAPQSVYAGVDRGMFESDTAITGPAMQRMKTEGVSYIYQNGYYNMGLAAAVITAAVATWIACRRVLVSGVGGLYYSGHGYYFTQGLSDIAMFDKAKYDVAFDRLRQSGTHYEMEVNLKVERLQMNCFKQELLYLEKNGYLAKGSVNYEALTIAEYESHINKLSGRQYEVLYKEGGTLDKFSDPVRAEVAKSEPLIEEKWAKVRAKQAVLNERVNVKAGFWGRYGARMVAVIAGVAAVGMAVYELYDLFSKSDKKITYSDEDMPFRIVNRTYPSGSDKITFVTYAAVCTAADKKADLRGWNGNDGWLNIYTTTDPVMGDPILAEGFGVINEAVSADPNVVTAAVFGSKDAYDITGGKEFLSFRRSDAVAAAASDEEIRDASGEDVSAADKDLSDPADDGKTLESTTSVFGWPGILWIMLVLLALAIVAVGTGIYFKKRKKSE